MQRRRLLQLGAAATAVLSIAGIGIAVLQPGLREGVPTAASREIFAAVARAVLDGVLPTEPVREAAIDAHLQRVQQTIQGFPPETQRELSLLLGALGTTAGRRALTSLAEPWISASVPQVQAAMQDMRLSTITARQQIYQALRDITNGAYFADPTSWSAIGYPGPLEI